MARCILVFGTLVAYVAIQRPAKSDDPPPPAGYFVPVHSPARESPFVQRPFRPYLGKEWIGNGIAYGPHRDGQRPGGPSPSKEELREDLQLLSQHWRLLRMYSSRGPSETVLRLIHEEGLGLKMMLGAWIGTEAKVDANGRITERFPETALANRAEVEAAIKLANAYPDIVIAVSVGNETQVSWSAHGVRADVLIAHLRRARAATTVPVATADDFSYWNKPESKALAREVDFILMHAHAMWNKQPLEKAIQFTKGKHAEVAAMHPRHRVVIGEAGWATKKHNQGEQSRLIIGAAGEDQQERFNGEFTTWIQREQIPSFFFEAFDENWKGGDHPNEVEKHWGLFRANRTPKKALQNKEVIPTPK